MKKKVSESISAEDKNAFKDGASSCCRSFTVFIDRFTESIFSKNLFALFYYFLLK